MKPVSANQANIQQATELLKQGKLVAIPTETVYGLGADAKNPTAVNKIFAAKGRPTDHPLIVHIADVDQLQEWAVNIPETAYKLAEKFWPGPLTLVLNKHPSVPDVVTGGQDTVALRVPNHPVALAVLNAFGGGIAAPSANRFCRISPTQAVHVEEELGDKVDMILDGGACQVGLESTIVGLTDAQVCLLRPGLINSEDIEAVLQSRITVHDTMNTRVPGMMAMHYSPRTYSMLCTLEQIKDIQLECLLRNVRSKKLGILAFSGQIQSDEFSQVVNMPEKVEDYSRALYVELRNMDNAGVDIILIEQPLQNNLWHAVKDRLSKAARPFSKLTDAFYENRKFELLGKVIDDYTASDLINGSMFK